MTLKIALKWQQWCIKILKMLLNYSISLRKRLRIRSVMSVNYHYITVLCPFNLLIRFKCYNIL